MYDFVRTFCSIFHWSVILQLGDSNWHTNRTHYYVSLAFQPGNRPRNPMQIRYWIATCATRHAIHLSACRLASFEMTHTKHGLSKWLVGLYLLKIQVHQLYFVCLQFCTHRESSDKKEFPTFARTRPPDTQISKSVVSVLMAFNWTKVSRMRRYVKNGQTDFLLFEVYVQSL